ncbi:Ubiquitin carboxyl-terminal hydrolase 25 [Turnera subulata]|uniref:ubiquitinyl hydrolase 1 n=1 Tax=Turnera subulata TaxID=218843 RepID=A0A9Q0F2M5_9ROSI|nr:Ubiquitin carboxyl-terminal hydrolase 25 [Turnera subulata]
MRLGELVNEWEGEGATNFCLRSQHSSLCDSDRDRDCPFCILEKRIVRSLRLNLPLDAPLKMQSCLLIFADHFRCGSQEDAHEFLCYVIDTCHNTSLRLLKLRHNPNPNTNDAPPATTSTVVKDIFGGSLQSQVKCLSCEGVEDGDGRLDLAGAGREHVLEGHLTGDGLSRWCN